MEFQLIDTDARDEDSKYIIHLFGRTLDGRSVNAKVVGFKPYFFIKLQSNAEHAVIDDILKSSDSISVEQVKKIEYYGFTNKRQQVYLKCSVNSISEKNNLQNAIKNADGYIATYEAKMLPYLRFFHERNIEPSGWITCKKFKENPKKSYCDESILVHCNNVEKFVPEETVNAPFKISSFDIECIPGDNFSFPDPVKKGDPIIQIGTTTNVLGQPDKIIKHIVTLNTCDPIDGVTVISVKTEKELLRVWCEYIRQIDPDIITGYNTFGFDYNYIAKRCKLYNFYLNLSRLDEIKVTYPNNYTNIIKKTLSSAAYGKNDMYYINSPGRIPIDLFKVVQKDYKFESFKLDNVAGEFICGKITGVKCGKESTQISVNTTADVDAGNFISIKIDKLREYSVGDTVKFVVERVGNNKLIIAGVHPELSELIKDRGLMWSLKKDDISVKDIFSFQKIDSHHRSLIASYCIQDNVLCNKLMEKIQYLTSCISMSNVCFVPISFLIFRGQDIKAYSIIAKKCLDLGYIIRDIDNSANVNNEKYQGAIVLEAKVGGHFYPVVCNDFASLYPSTIISHNLSPDCLIEEQNSVDIDNHYIPVSDTSGHTFSTPEKDWDGPEATRPGRGVIPQVLIDLLANRKNAKKMMANAPTDYLKNIYNCLQTAYKLTANSIYGTMGSQYGSVSCRAVAESTTAAARGLLQLAINKTKELYPNCEIIYGDTDSVFVKYLDVPKDATQEQKVDILSKSMDCGRFVEETVGKFLPWPHKLEYEKLYFPYLLYSKKRYSGVMYENDPLKYSKVDNKGIILTRRDNAKIVKYIFQGALEYILFKSDPKGAYNFITETITKMCNGEFGEDMFKISKAYKLTATETHNNAVLERGSGVLKTEQPQMSLIRKRRARGDTSIQYNDRINFMFIKISKEIEKELLLKTGKKALTQGDRVEDPEYIRAHPEIQIDYSHYISNQITNPLIDLMAIFEEGTEKQREKIVEEYFQTFINEEQRKEAGVRKITDYFSKKQ